MPRIPASELERLKSDVSLEKLAEARGVKLVRKGRELHGCCPFHPDKTPSLVISPEKNVWNCLGACQTGGSVLDWVMKAEGISFRHAVELLRADLPKLSAGDAPVVKHSTVRKLPPLASSNVEEQVLAKKVVDYYHQTLLEEEKAQAYLKSRKIFSPELVKHFKLGFSNRTLGYRLPQANRKEGAEVRERLKRLGLYRENGREHLRGSFTVPLFDEAGSLVQMYGRKITPNLRKGTALHLYLPGPQRGVWNLEALQQSEEIILCESLIDAMTFWAHGIRNVTAAYGTSGVTEDHWKAFSKYETKRIYIAFDRDAAGEKAAEELAKKLQELGIEAFRVQFPKGMDANEYALKMEPTSKALSMVVRHAVWLGAGERPKTLATKEEGPAVSASPVESVDDEENLPSALPPLVAESVSPLGPIESIQPPISPTPIIPEPSSISERSDPKKLVKKGEEFFLTLGDRTYRIRGLSKNLTHSVMKVNLFVRRDFVGGIPTGTGFHVDTLDLYQSRPRKTYAREAAQELGLEETTVNRDLGELLLALEAAQTKQLKEALEPKEDVYEMSAKEREEALALLKSKDLLGQILKDFEDCGVVGERTNKLAGYLAATSRKLERPLAIVVQSNSAAGKSSLMDAVLAFMPEEEQVCYSAMTGQSLFYMSGSNLKHKILAIAEEEGAQRASYALKLLQSEGQLTIASTGKDATTGRLTTEDYKVEGPVMIFLTTTATDVDEELMNRCLVLAVDEGHGQTEAIHFQQRASQRLIGKRKLKEKVKILNRHKNAQRLLKPIAVDNPYAEQLTFLTHQTRFRRDHMKYLGLIEIIATLHQYQREKKFFIEEDGSRTEYIEVKASDITVANNLAHEILGQSVDELPPQTKNLLLKLTKEVKERSIKLGITQQDFRFTRREVREWTGVGNTQVQIHLRRLEELEYVLIHAGSRGKSIVYELLYEMPKEEGMPFFPGLFDVEAMKEAKPENYDYDLNLPGQKKNLPGLNRGQTGPKPGPKRNSSNALEGLESTLSSSFKTKSLNSSKNARTGSQETSHPTFGLNGTALTPKKLS